MPVATIPIPHLSESDKQRFFSRVSKIPTSKGCLEWTAGKSSNGYGAFQVSRRMFSTHRLAFSLATGEDPLDLLVRHSCHNKICCNPLHLSKGTQQDNMADMILAGRGATGDKNGARRHPERVPRGDSHYYRINPNSIRKGESIGNSKLTSDKVIAIRVDTRKQLYIAIDYGVSRRLIGMIKRRERWAHIA